MAHLTVTDAITGEVLISQEWNPDEIAENDESMRAREQLKKKRRYGSRLVKNYLRREWAMDAINLKSALRLYCATYRKLCSN